MKKWLSYKMSSLTFLVLIASVMWTMFLLQQAVPSLLNFSMEPRSVSGLWGIVCAPFLHGGLGHILSNTISLAMFFLVYTLVEKKEVVSVFMLIFLLSGVLMWILGGSGRHIGMSGVIFGLYGYLVTIGFFNRQLKYILVSIFMLAFYGVVLFQLFVVVDGVSWSGHALGFAAGVAVSRFRE